MDEADLTVAAVIRQARIILGYTQMDVAEMADISFGEYQRIEYGQRSIRNVYSIFARSFLTTVKRPPWKYAILPQSMRRSTAPIAKS